MKTTVEKRRGGGDRERRSSLLGLNLEAVELEADGHMPGTPVRKATPGTRSSVRSVIAVGVVVGIVGAYIRYGHLLTMEALRENQRWLRSTANTRPVASATLFVVAMIGDVALSLPGSTLFCFMSGLAFPQPLASVLSWAGFGFGSGLCFVLVQTVLGDYFQSQLDASPKLLGYFATFKSYLQDANGSQVLPMICIRYLLFIPHWFTNVSAALIGVPFPLFQWTTLVSCIPGTVLYTCAGAGLASVFEAQEAALARGETVAPPSTLEVLLSVVRVDSWRDRLLLAGFLSLFILVPLVVWLRMKKPTGRQAQAQTEHGNGNGRDGQSGHATGGGVVTAHAKHSAHEAPAAVITGGGDSAGAVAVGCWDGGGNGNSSKSAQQSSKQK